MSAHCRTSRLSRAAVVLSVVLITGALVVAAATDVDDDRALTEAEERQRRDSSHRQHERQRHQHTSDCNAVQQFARGAMRYTNVLPATKSHGICSFSGEFLAAALVNESNIVKLSYCPTFLASFYLSDCKAK